jgi:hypothetical protein
MGKQFLFTTPKVDIYALEWGEGAILRARTARRGGLGGQVCFFFFFFFVF